MPAQPANPAANTIGLHRVMFAVDDLDDTLTRLKGSYGVESLGGIGEQKIVPDAVLVGGAAAALYAGHRDSFDHDHVLSDLSERYAEVVAAVEASEGWVTSVRASSPPLTLLDSLDGIEAGLRHLRRVRPLEVEEVDVDGHVLRVPTLPECLRVKAYLMVQRNQVRDYLDTVALAERLGDSVTTLASIDHYYRDRSDGTDSVLTAVVQRLSEPTPRDTRVTRQLSAYKGLGRSWHDWSVVVAACTDLADDIVDWLGAQ
ncbi:MAG: hypothetical protein V9G19_02275 [Tetrasphaera sp.]